MIQTLGAGTGLLMLLSAGLIFAGACYLVATGKRPAVLASYLVLLPLPFLISVASSLKGAIASLMVIAAAVGLELKSAEIAEAVAASLMQLLMGLLVSAPTYFVLAFGLLRSTLDDSHRDALVSPGAWAKTTPRDLAGDPFTT